MAKHKTCPHCGQSPLAFPHPTPTHCSAECYLADQAEAARAQKKPVDMYHVYTHDHSISIVVGANSYRHAALIVAEVIAEGEPPGTGGVCCIDKLSSPGTGVGGPGLYVPFIGNDRWYHITPNKIKPLSSREKKARAYLEGGGVKCPFCGSKNIEGGDTTSYDHNARRVSCLDCHKDWEDIYTLTDVDLKP